MYADVYSPDAELRHRAMTTIDMLKGHSGGLLQYAQPKSRPADENGDVQAWTEGWVNAGGANGEAWDDAPVPRARDESPEEQARRRRRREAIVLNEGDRPVTQEDIIQRRRTD